MSRPQGAAARRATAATATLAALGALALVGCGRPAAGERPPDVVLLVVDTLRADRLSCYGYPRATTPTLDRLASEGALFEDATAQFAWTVPSMVSLFSGRYVTDWREVLPPEDPSLAEVFARAGYATLAGVSNQLLDEETGLRGFDLYDVRPSRREARKTDPERSRDLDELFADVAPALDRIVAAGDGRRPVFLYLHAYEPHDPYHARRRFEQLLPVEGAWPPWPGEWHLEGYRAGLGLEPEQDSAQFEALARYRGQYDHELRYLDEQLAAVLAELEGRGLLERCVIAVASDHGEGLWDHLSPAGPEPARGPGEFFYGQHGAVLHEEALRTPLVFWGAGVPAGARVDSAAENVDLFPTLLELAGIEPDPVLAGALHGRSLVPLMRGLSSEAPEREHVFAYASDGRAMVREPASGLKLVLREERPVALFDLSTDPAERVDLLAERPDEAERLRALFVAWREQHGSGEVASELLRDDAEELERLRRLGYTEVDIGR